MKILKPSYESRKEWRMDPKGYFLIKVFYSEGLIGVRHCTPQHEVTNEIKGSDSYALVQTLVREGLVTTPQHAAYLGHELHKAEVALQKKLEYIQDDPLDFSLPYTRDPSENSRKPE